MATPEFDISIGKDGKVKVTVHGVSGSRCLELTDALREILGREESRQLTPEYYAPESVVRNDAAVRGKRGVP